jgi:hypothetical protein
MMKTPEQKAKHAARERARRAAAKLVARPKNEAKPLGVKSAVKVVDEAATKRRRGAYPTGAEKPKNVRTGLRDRPKNKRLAITRAGARDVTFKALAALVAGGNLTENERFEADRMIARLRARGVAG